MRLRGAQRIQARAPLLRDQLWAQVEGVTTLPDDLAEALREVVDEVVDAMLPS